ncbi:DUF998 domain-containing protein [Agreia sp. COWG]|uniref:DUF998 domain-containing protein n=1 Tax=Agreia sp. COWG TaxID=2773266 RepID=UPI0019286A6E|nr:DUF998 domain-containing protein [Agreia sp. COWG]CAD5993853.1 conserved membrane protein of unknown function [Agreia sp. COWG]
MAAPTASGRPSPFVRGVASLGVGLVLLYVVIDVALQLLPPHYSAISDAESNLAVGPFGWLMSVNFVSRAVLTLCVVVVVGRVGPPTAVRLVGCVLVSLAGVCSAALVFFPTDVNGPGEFGIAPTTATGTVHVVFATTGFLLALAGMLLLASWMRGMPQMARVRRAANGFVVLASSGLVLLAVSIAWVPSVLGLTERVCLAGILGWAFVVCRTSVDDVRESVQPLAG